MKACQLFFVWKIFEKEYALINRECGPFAKIFVLTSSSQQIFSVWTKLKVNKSFIVYPHK